jgi:hypothetical protein
LGRGCCTPAHYTPAAPQPAPCAARPRSRSGQLCAAFPSGQLCCALRSALPSHRDVHAELQRPGLCRGVSSPALPRAAATPGRSARAAPQHALRVRSRRQRPSLRSCPAPASHCAPSSGIPTHARPTRTHARAFNPGTHAHAHVPTPPHTHTFQPGRRYSDSGQLLVRHWYPPLPAARHWEAADLVGARLPQPTSFNALDMRGKPAFLANLQRCARRSSPLWGYPVGCSSAQR